MDNQLWMTIKLGITAVLFIYLVRNTIKLRQLGMFASNFHEKVSQFFPKPFPLTSSNVEDFPDPEVPQEKKSFMIPIEELINGFGFDFDPEKFSSLLENKSFPIIAYSFIFLQVLEFGLIVYFILGINLAIVACGISCLLFLLLIL